jgi:hypothetical protein
MTDPLDFLIGKVVLADLGSYSVSGKLISCRCDELTLQTKRGARVLINRLEAISIMELAGRRRARSPP